MKKAAELREKSSSELKDLLSTKLRDQFKLSLVKAGGELTQMHKIREIRRAIARLLTILAEKQGSRDE
jgi:large subunit ribosomal protein L29